MLIFISLTVIPSRLATLWKCLKSLENQTVQADKIFLNVPIAYKRFTEVISNEQLMPFKSNTIQIVRCEDYGPGTKLMGSLPQMLNEKGLVILVDDDVQYKPYLIERLKETYEKTQKSCSFYVYGYTLKEGWLKRRRTTFKIGQGVDGFAMHTDMLSGLPAYFNEIKENQDLFYHDDVWISYYLYLNGVDIINANSEGKCIYDIVSDPDALSRLKGEQRRGLLIKRGLKYLRKKYEQPTLIKAIQQLRRAFEVKA